MTRMSLTHGPGLREQDHGWLPDTLEKATLEKDMDFTESSFFQVGTGRRLPTVPTVDANHQGISVVSEMRLLIKFGPYGTIEEALTMRAVRKRLGHQVPVPEVFGWRVRQDRVFIYMELISGTTLQERWDDLNLSEKDSLCEQLSQILSSLRQLEQRDEFIGSITRGPLLDRVFYDRPKTGPFNSLDNFYNFLEWLPQRFLLPSQRYKDPYLEVLRPQEAYPTSIKFTHADVHPTNIMVSAALDLGPPRILALIDWGQAGWYPDYWEYFKMCYTTDPEGVWRNTYVPKIIEPREYEHYLLAGYTMSIGAT